MKILRVVLGDQLNRNHSWFKVVDPDLCYLMVEARDEATYVTHHIQKILGFFAAMRAFAAHLRSLGHIVRYLSLDDPEGGSSLAEVVERVARQMGASRIEYQLPDEYRVDQAFLTLQKRLDIPVAAADTEHFFTARSEVAELFKGKKGFLMESFYREMRRRHCILMRDGAPAGDLWNFDRENRKPLKKGETPPPALNHHNDLSTLESLVRSSAIPTMGVVNASDFRWPITREQALESLEHFAARCLPHFGEFQDAMHSEHPFLYHSLLSFPLNLKLLSPREVIDRCIAEWERRPEEISLPQIEGFVRQILGWREYMRGLYWARMPQFEQENFFEAELPLPAYYWSGETGMNCMRAAISQSLELAYAHHIQRLMITGNFALISGVNPKEVDDWYLGIYIDALQWVELPNTRGMSQFADGGIVATKPYAASANYIGKMSNYCAGCRYDPKRRYGDGACPFNSLYWDFFDRNRGRLEKNPRVVMAYRNLDRMASEELVQIRAQARRYRASLNSL